MLVLLSLSTTSVIRKAWTLNPAAMTSLVPIVPYSPWQWTSWSHAYGWQVCKELSHLPAGLGPCKPCAMKKSLQWRKDGGWIAGWWMRLTEDNIDIYMVVVTRWANCISPDLGSTLLLHVNGWLAYILDMHWWGGFPWQLVFKTAATQKQTGPWYLLGHILIGLLYLAQCL